MEIHPYRTIEGLISQLNLTEEQISKECFQQGGIWFPNTKTIVCGTFPPKTEYFGRKGYLHYSSPRNQFWKHIDCIYQTALFLNKTNLEEEQKRINNAIDKINFLKSMKLGFVDVYSSICRVKEGSTRDEDIVGVESIFDNGIFEQILSSNVSQFVFVYSLSRDEFSSNVAKKFGTPVEIIREYNFENIPLQTKKINISGKQIYLSYAPIHGRIRWDSKQRALKRAFDSSFV
jgi:hypothetical protein